MCSVPRIASITRAIERSFQFRTGSALMTRTGCLRTFLNIYIVEEREAYSIKKVIRLCQNLTTKCASFWPSLFYGTERNLSPHYSTGRSGICLCIILRKRTEHCQSANLEFDAVMFINLFSKVEVNLISLRKL